MADLLRAEWIRSRRRFDLWLVLLGAILVPSLAFLSGLHSAYSSEDPARALHPEIGTQLEAVRLLYAFPTSILTLLDQSGWVVAATALIAASWVGADFSSGVIRNLVLVQPRRDRLLAARLLSLLSAVTVLVGGLVLAGSVLPLVVPGVGFDPSQSVSPQEVLARIGWLWLSGASYCVLSMLITVATRSTIVGFVGSVGYFLCEGLITGTTAFHGTGVAQVWELFLGVRLQALAASAHVGNASAGFSSTSSLSPGLGVAIIVVWLVVLCAATAILFRRLEIRE